MVNFPILSIITVVLNGAQFIERTIKSVIQQSFKDFEYIIIDGGSIDVTVDIIKKYENNISSWISEKDQGISDAFNKGIVNAHGKWIAFLNCGDCYNSESTLANVSPFFQSHTNAIYGKMALVNTSNNIIRIYGEPFSRAKFNTLHSIPHPSTFMKRSYFDRFGYFDLSFKYAMDYELFLRGGKEFDPLFIDLIISRFLNNGISQKYYIPALNESIRAAHTHLKVNTYALSLRAKLIIFKYYLRQIIFFFKK